MSRGSDGIGFIVYLVSLGGLFFWKGFQNLRLHKKISGLATSRARSMAMGLVELSGVAKITTSPCLDPLYSMPCCFFQLKVEQYRKSGKSGKWVTIHEESSDGTPFLCRDATGEVVVVPKKPEIHFANRLVVQNYFFGNKNTIALEFLKKRWTGSLRLTFDVLRDGDPLYVIGCALSRRTTISQEIKVPKVVSDVEVARELKVNAQAMKDIDTNKDGHVDSLEWERGVEKYRKFLEAKRGIIEKPQTPMVPLTFDGVVTESEEHELVFANSEKDLLSKLGLAAYLQVIGGGVALIMGLIFIVAKLS